MGSHQICRHIKSSHISMCISDYHHTQCPAISLYKPPSQRESSASARSTWQQCSRLDTSSKPTHTSKLHKHAAYNSTQMLIVTRHAQLFELTTTTTQQRIINQGGGVEVECAQMPSSKTESGSSSQLTFHNLTDDSL